MKPLLQILALLILLNIAFIGISFFIPGRIGFVDSYSLMIEKGVVNWMEKRSPGPGAEEDHADPFTRNAISHEELVSYLEDIRPGTLFFTNHGRTVSSRFIDGRWKHCGIYLGTLEQIQCYWGRDHDLVQFLRGHYSSKYECLILDSSYENGVAIHAINDLADLSGNSTLRSLLLFECKLEKEHWSQVLLSNKEHLGKAYDYFFVLDNDHALYCSELLYSLLQLDRNQLTPSRKILGREFLLPSDLVQYLLKSDEGLKKFTCKGSIGKSNGRIIHFPGV